MNPKFDPNQLAMKVGQLSEGVAVSLQRIKGAIEECKESNLKVLFYLPSLSIYRYVKSIFRNHYDVYEGSIQLVFRRVNHSDT